MMIHVNSTTGTHISVNLPTVTPELIALAEKAPGKRLVLEVIDPVRSEVEQRFIDAARDEWRGMDEVSIDDGPTEPAVSLIEDEDTGKITGAWVAAWVYMDGGQEEDEPDDTSKPCQLWENNPNHPGHCANCHHLEAEHQ